MTIGVIGLWHLGEVVSVGLCELGHSVIAVDDDATVIANFKNGRVPVAEPQITELVKRHQSSGQLKFSADYSDLGGCEAVVLAFDTPVTETDEPDTAVLFSAAKNMAPYLQPDALLVIMSQITVGVTKELANTIKRANQSWHGEFAYFPENLRLGEALLCFLKPDRLVIGADTDSARFKLESIIADIVCPRLMMSVASAEMSKHALNAFLSTSLSFTYALSDLCEATGADVVDVMSALKADRRIGPHAYLDTGIGFSGGTLMRDLRSLAQLNLRHNRSVGVIEAVTEANLRRRDGIVQRMEQLLSRPLGTAKLGILGVTYKPGTPTLRRSLSLELMEKLKARGAQTVAHDPGAEPAEFKRLTGDELFTDLYQMAAGCHGIILVTAWPEFGNLDFARLKSVMQPPHLFFDTRNFYKSQAGGLQALGLDYYGLGR
ncbi:MAG: nucleotide sugar dehydrogenase [Patescibacteria group bacterium]